MDAIFRQANPDDAAAAAALIARSIRALCAADHGGAKALIAAWTDTRTAERITALIGAPGAWSRIVEHDDAIVGVAAMTGTGTLELLYVDPDAAGAGIGATLLEAAEDAARAAGLARITLDSTRTARPFSDASAIATSLGRAGAAG